jgi:excisionase family DNA binding protein
VPVLLTPREAQEALRISRATFTRLVARGEIRAARVGGQLRVSVSEIERLAAAGALGPREAA